VFERLTDGSRRAVALAEDEARALRHHYIGAEQLLLGILDLKRGVAVEILRESNV
jgi:ATP-dependent Clp protease ATP-binding subunit ClpC